MTDIQKAKLSKMLENVPQSYVDFVNGALREAEEHNAFYIISDYIIAHPFATSSDIIRDVLNELNGIKPIDT